MLDFFTALGLLLVIEGLFLALFPHRIRQLLEALDQIPMEVLRIFGLAAAIVGVGIVWLIRG